MIICTSAFTLEYSVMKVFLIFISFIFTEIQIKQFYFLIF